MEVPKPKHRSRGRSVREKQREALSRCASCGTPLAKIVESAAVGCALCYTAFGKEIESMLEALHRGPMHRGKSFSSSDDRIRLMSELQSKRLLLRSMLKEEKYEEAARLRDEIAHLEKQVHSSEVHSQRRGE
jgi:protein arginine kinase activator